MTERVAPVAPVVTLHLKLAADMGRDLTKDATILDLGCGVGGTVEPFRSAGYKAFGVDMARDLDAGEQRIREVTHDDSSGRILRQLELTPYRIPFDDNTFDYVFSEQVLEHVANYEESLAENWRVLKPGGFSLHVFPSRWRPVEPHVFVPFGGVMRASRTSGFGRASGSETSFSPAFIGAKSRGGMRSTSGAVRTTFRSARSSRKSRESSTAGRGKNWRSHTEASEEAAFSMASSAPPLLF